MQYQLAMKYANGEMPPDCYRVPGTVDELIEIIERFNFGCSIRKDTTPGHGFTFGRTQGGKWWFATDEFIDDAERTRNPDFRECRFDTVRDGVRKFTINGKPLFDCVNGCRMMRHDCGCVIPD